MGRLRTATATLARLGCPPGEIMAQLNQVAPNTARRPAPPGQENGVRGRSCSSPSR